MTSDFYPRSPCGERHGGAGCVHIGHAISIHALLAESDGMYEGGELQEKHFYPRSPCGERPISALTISQTGNFYPRSPCGERLLLSGALCGLIIFLSTLSLRRATYWFGVLVVGCPISIHALLAESDGGFAVGSWPHGIFLSTLSLRRATMIPTQKFCA